MDPDDQKRLRMNYTFLLSNLRAEDVVDYLFQEGILSEDNCEEINTERKTKDRTKTLLKIIPKKGPRAYRTLINVLRDTSNDFIADRLESTDISQTSYDLDSPTGEYPDDGHPLSPAAGRPISSREGDDLLLRDIRRQMSHQAQLLWETKSEMERLKAAVKNDQEESDKLKQRLQEMEEDAIRKGYTEKEINQQIIEIISKYPNAPTDTVSKHEAQTDTSRDEPEGCLTDSSDDLGRDAIRIEARLIAKDIVNYVSKRTSNPPPNKHCQTMRNTVDELLVKYDGFFKQIFPKLGLQEITKYKTFESIANEVLEGDINWGRVVAVYAYSGSLARYCVEQEMDNLVDRIGEFTGKYAARVLCDWIIWHGGWDRFDEHFPDKKSSAEKQWSQLLWPVVGIGALVGLLLK